MLSGWAFAMAVLQTTLIKCIFRPAPRTGNATFLITNT